MYGKGEVMKVKMKNKVFAWLMIFGMVISLISVPKLRAFAADDTVTVTNAKDSTKPVYVKFEVEEVIAAGSWYKDANTMSPAEDMSQYKVTVVNNSGGTISDWTVTIKCPSQNTGWNSGWNGATASGDTITITPTSGDGWTNATIYNGQSASGAGMLVFTSAIDNGTVTLTYKNGESTGGSTGGTTGGERGNTPITGEDIGTIDTSKDYNFAKLLQLSLYFYDANMCGDKVVESSLYSTAVGGWRGNCHTNDKFTYNGKEYSAVGGYHDAGDHVKFGMPMNESFVVLGLAYMNFGEAFSELGQTKHFRTIVDYYCTYVKSCTVLDDAGTTALAHCYQVGCGQKDHESWTSPETEDQSKTQRTYTLVATKDNPATEYVSGAAAALAINYINFGNEEDLKYAKALFKFAMNNTKSNGTTDSSGDFYNSGWGSWEDEYMMAAAMLYKATKDSTYATEYSKYNKNQGNIEKPMGWENLYQLESLYAPTVSSSEKTTINNYLTRAANGSKSSFYTGDSTSNVWGSARINCNVQFTALLYDKLSGTNNYTEWSKYQMSMILGNNSTGKNLVVGYNQDSPTKPHHRAASGYGSWTGFNNDATQKYTLYGALVGGPKTTDFSTYVDSVKDSQTNEVTLDYNAGMVGAAAALYLAYKDSKDAGFTNQTILSDFYGGKNVTADKLPAIYKSESETPDPPSVDPEPEPGEHDFKQEEISERTLASVATCEAPAYYYESCRVCNVLGEKTFSVGDPLGHNYKADTVKDEARKSEADYYNPAVYYYSCTRCGKVDKTGATFTSGTALKGTVTLNKINVTKQDYKGFAANGDVTANPKAATLEYRWRAKRSEDNKGWVVISDWTKANNSLEWTPDIYGKYEVELSVRVAKDDTTIKTKSVEYEYHPYIKGICQMPAALMYPDRNGYLIGVETYDGAYDVEMLILDCTLYAQGKDAWVYTTNKIQPVNNCMWTIWDPQYGYYWTLYRAFDKEGNLVDEVCYGFENI